MNGAELRGVPLDTLREWYADQVEQQTIRAVAEESGINSSALRSFLQGKNPHPRVRRSLAIYFVRVSGLVTPAARADALAVLASGLPEPEQDRLSREVLGMLAEAHTRNGTVPDWLSAMLAEGA